MNKQRNALFKRSKETAQRLAKEAIKDGSRIEEEGSFPIYMVVLSHDKNDDILIIHSNYSFEPFKNTEDENPGSNDAGTPENIKKLPGDKPMRNLEGNKMNKPGNKPNQEETGKTDC
jgi:hypothetical protein